MSWDDFMCHVQVLFFKGSSIKLVHNITLYLQDGTIYYPFLFLFGENQEERAW